MCFFFFLENQGEEAPPHKEFGISYLYAGDPFHSSCGYSLCASFGPLRTTALVRCRVLDRTRWTVNPLSMLSWKVECPAMFAQFSLLVGWQSANRRARACKRMFPDSRPPHLKWDAQEWWKRSIIPTGKIHAHSFVLGPEFGTQYTYTYV